MISLLLAACMGGNTSTGDGDVPGGSASAAVAGAATQRVFTAHDDGRRVTLRRGQVIELIVRDADAPDPRVEGDAIELIAISNVTASGSRQWEIRARAVGVARINVASKYPFSLTIEVTP